MDPEKDDVVPDLSGLQPRYDLKQLRGLRWVVLVVATLQVVLAIDRLVRDHGWFDVLFSAFMAVGYLIMIGAFFVWPAATILSPEGVQLRKGWPRTRVTPWSQVRGVQVQGRWSDFSLLLLEGGREEKLQGVPMEDAQRLADALAARR